MPIYLQIIPASLPIAVESIGNNWAQPSLQRMAGYPYYHWLQTQSGAGEVQIGPQQVILGPGEGILIPPFLPHAYYPKGEWVTRFMTFNGSLEEDFPKILGTNRYLLSADREDFSFSAWIDDTIAKLTSGTLQANQCSMGCYAFLLHLSKGYEDQANLRHPLFLQYVEPTIRKIETDYAQELRVEELAGALFISPQYLTRLFKRFTGKSTQAYLLEFRLLKAKELLVNLPDRAIQEVAQSVGFISASRFSELFKQRYNMTPTAFRHIHI